MAAAPSPAAERRYDVEVAGKTTRNLDGDEIELLFSLGEIDRASKCRVNGTTTWSTIDEFFPLLKHGGTHIQPRPARAESLGELDGRSKRAMTSSIKAGWICLGIGFCVAWIFPPAHVFYSASIVLAIVALATNQVRRGLVLLISSFVAAGISALITFLLALGFLGAAVKPHFAQMEADAARVRELQRKSELQIQKANEQIAKDMKSAPAPSNIKQVDTRPLSQRTPRELLDEIARVEEQHRRTTAQGKEVPKYLRHRLDELRKAYDQSSARQKVLPTD